MGERKTQDAAWQELISDFSTSFRNLRSFLALDEKLKAEHESVREANPVANAVMVGMSTSSLATMKPDDKDLQRNRDEYITFINTVYKGILEFHEVEGVWRVSFSDLDAAADFETVLDELGSIRSQGIQLRRATLTQLISTVEAYIPRAIALYPSALSLAKSTLTYGDLLQCGDIDEAKALLLERRISEELYGSVSDWLSFTKQAFKVGASYIDEFRDELIEIALRRNLFVHNDGIINSAYLATLPRSVTQRPKRGDTLTLGAPYLRRALKVYEISFTLLFAEAWDKAGGEPNAIAETLGDLAYKSLCSEQWDSAKAFTQFTQNDKRVDRTIRLYATINRWQAYKWSGSIADVESEINAFSISALTKDFSVAKAILSDQPPKKVFGLISSALESKSLRAEALFTWPLFRELRKTANFRTFVSELSLREPEKRRLEDIFETRISERMAQQGERDELVSLARELKLRANALRHGSQAAEIAQSKVGRPRRMRKSSSGSETAKASRKVAKTALKR